MPSSEQPVPPQWNISSASDLWKPLRSVPSPR